jgi:integrase
MASINVRKETGKLYFDFRFRNQRCREQSDLKDTVLNRKRMQIMLDKIQAEIMLGQFDYRATFPNSNLLQKLDAAAQIISAASANNLSCGIKLL